MIPAKINPGKYSLIPSNASPCSSLEPSLLNMAIRRSVCVLVIKRITTERARGSSNSVAQKPFGGEGVAFTVITADQRLGALRYTVKHSGCHKSEIGDHTIGGNADITGNPKDQKIKGCGCYTG